MAERGADRFPTTRLSLVLAASMGPSAQSKEALAGLCRIYWHPLFAYVRRQGYSAEEAEDITQGFFARVLEKHYLRDFQKERGRFRSFLLGSLKHFMANERDWVHAQKRGGGMAPVPLDAVLQSDSGCYNLEPRDDLTPEKLFERQWALTILNRVMAQLQAESAHAGKQEQFDRLKLFLTGEHEGARYSLLAAELGMTEGSVKVAIHRLRHRFGDILREEISQTVVHADEVGDEIRFLMAAIRA
jgi:DNA-directed RNA polymerase specialized sigma24 family protein